MSNGRLLSAQHRSQISRIQQRCNECQPQLEFLRGIGFPQEEEEQRLLHLREISEAALRLDEEYANMRNK